MDRGSSKHGPKLDEEMERESSELIKTGQPSRAEEWLQTEPVGENHLEPELPPDQEPGAPAGMTAIDAEARSYLARHLPPGAFPADRDGLLAYLSRTSAPDEASAAIGLLPSGRQFATIGEVVRELGIPTER